MIGAAGLAGSGILVGCGSDGGAAATTTTTASPLATPPPLATPFLIPSAPDGLTGPSPFVFGREHRLAYALHDGNDVMRRTAPDSVELAVADSAGNVIATSNAVRRDVGVGGESLATPYYSIYFTPPTAGQYQTTLTNDAGSNQRDLLVVDPSETTIPQPGDLLPPIPTATLDNSRDVDPICTRPGEFCPFHDIDLVDALDDSAKPTVLSIATPGFCRTSICGPVVELLIEAAAQRDDLHFIHAEVYADPHNQTDAIAAGRGDFTEVVSAYGLPFEPVLFVADAGGVIQRRLDAIYDGSELAEALALV